MKTLDKFAPHILGATWVLAGTLFFCDGARELLGAFGGPSPGTAALTHWVAGLIQLVSGSLLVAGLFTRAAAFVASGLKAFAYFIGHAQQGFWPIENGGERPTSHPEATRIRWEKT